MLDSMRLRGAIALASAPTSSKPFGTPGLTAKSSISLFRITPVPGAMNPEPNQALIDWVPATRLPSASMMEKWVVSVALAPSGQIPGNAALGVARSRRIETRCPAA